MTDRQRRALAKIRRCLDLAADVRGNATERETAWRQAQALIQKHGLQLEKFEAGASAQPPVAPSITSPEWGAYWAQRTTADAMRAGIKTTVLCRDGWHVPG